MSSALSVARRSGLVYGDGERLACKAVGELAYLLTSGGVERDVRVALKPSVTVPVGLPMPHEDDLRDHADTLAALDLGLEGKSALVTGSTGGIGLETVRLLVAEGARVVTCGRRDAPGVGELAHVVADLSQPGEPERVTAQAAGELSGLDVLVNNAGVARHARFEDVPDQEWDAYWQLNVMSYALSAQLFRVCARPAGRSSTSPRRPESVPRLGCLTTP